MKHIMFEVDDHSDEEGFYKIMKVFSKFFSHTIYSLTNTFNPVKKDRYWRKQRHLKKFYKFNDIILYRNYRRNTIEISYVKYNEILNPGYIVHTQGISIKHLVT